MDSPLLVDQYNKAELHAFYLAQAAKFFRERQAEGCDVTHASAQAVAYLRRKTGWNAPMALGALTCALKDQGWIT